MATKFKPASSDTVTGAVAISADGAVIAFGATNADNEGIVYIRYGTNHSSQVIVQASNTAANDSFGYSISLSSDGSVLVVGANTAAGGGTSDGSVYIYSGALWAVETIKLASDPNNNARYGIAVDISDDGTTVIVGASGNDAGGANSGKVYVYNGVLWVTEAKVLVASDAAAGDLFGDTAAISGDKAVIAVGIQGSDTGGSNTGSVYIYSGAVWGTETKKQTSDNADGDNFGVSVDCNETGSVVVGGMSRSGAPSTMHIFSGVAWGTDTSISAEIPLTGADDYFGVGVAISPNGNHVFNSTNLELTSIAHAGIYGNRGTLYADQLVLPREDVGYFPDEYFINAAYSLRVNNTLAIMSAYGVDTSGAIYLWQHSETEPVTGRAGAGVGGRRFTSDIRMKY